MVNQSEDVFIIELAPGAFYVAGHPDNKVVTTGRAYRATPVEPAALPLESFSKEAFPHARLVRLRITAVEIAEARPRAKPN